MIEYIYKGKHISMWEFVFNAMKTYQPPKQNKPQKFVSMSYLINKINTIEEK